jgi:RNA polymerase sigma factor (sigma-70 family)
MTQPLYRELEQSDEDDRPLLVALPDLPQTVDLERWAAAWQHRSLLLGVARQRVDAHLAEDVVSEAMLRAATAGEIRELALRSWLVTTTIRLCADVHRKREREARRDVRLTSYELTVVPAVDEDVVDDLQAQWLETQVDRLPERQARALHLRAKGHDIGAIAVAMVLPYKSVESLLSRGRGSLRGWAGALLLTVGGWRTLAKRKAQVHVAAATLTAAADISYDVASAAARLVGRGL